MSSIPADDDAALVREHAGTLRRAAADSIRHGLGHGVPLLPDVESHAEPLRRDRACFVTLNSEGRLRGCIGSILAHRPLVTDVAMHAYNAAFRDYRFPPLQKNEWNSLTISISVLGSLERLAARTERELLERLRPGVDGLVLIEGSRHSALLPQVWANLRDPELFLALLKEKAGLPPDYWSATIEIARFLQTTIPVAPVAESAPPAAA